MRKYIRDYVSSIIAFNSVGWSALGAAGVVLFGLVECGTAAMHKLYIHRRGRCAIQKLFLYFVLHTDPHRAALLPTGVQERSWPFQELTCLTKTAQKACT